MIRKLLDSIFSISIIFSSFMLVNIIPYASSQEDTNNSQAIQLQQKFDQLSPEQQKMVLPLVQKAFQKTIMESSPEQQELMGKLSQQALKDASPEQQKVITQQLKQMFPPQVVEKLLPDENK